MVITRVKVIDIPDVAHCYADVEEMSLGASSLAYIYMCLEDKAKK